MWRSRYFVVDCGRAALAYFGSRSKMEGGEIPRLIPFSRLLSVKHHPDKKKGRRFDIRVTSRRTYDLLAKNRKEAELWVASLLKVLPRENIAAIIIQATWRGWSVKRHTAPLYEAAREEKRRNEERKRQMEACVAPVPPKSVSRPASKSVSKSVSKPVSKPAWTKQRQRAGSALSKPHTSATSSRLAKLSLLRQRREADALALRKRENERPKQPLPEVKGWMKRRNRSGKTWRRRYFALETATGDVPHALMCFRTMEGCIGHYEDDESACTDSLCGLIKLGDGLTVNDCVAEDLPHPGLNVSTNTVDLTLCPPTEDELTMWKLALTAIAGLSCDSGLDVKSSPPAEDCGEWKEMTDPESGNVFYYNSKSGEKSWTKPDADNDDCGDDEWMEMTDPNSGHVFYCNKKTGEKSWTRPEGAEKAMDDSNWIEMMDTRYDRYYYVNESTGETSWTRPGSGSLQTSEANIAPSSGIPVTTELSAFTCLVNEFLGGDDRHVQLPLDPDSDLLFHALRDGVLLCALVGCIASDGIDERVVNVPDVGEELTEEEAIENLVLALSTARGYGCAISDDILPPESVYLGASNGIEGRDAVLDMLWQLLRQILLADVNIKVHPELVQLLDEEEDMSALLLLSPDDILLRWVNFHLLEADVDECERFGAEMANGVAFQTLTAAILATDGNDEAIVTISEDSSAEERAKAAVEMAFALGCVRFTSGSALCEGNSRICIAFFARLFAAKSGLVLPEAEDAEVAAMLAEEETDGQEERVFRAWINSLHLPGIFVQNLFEDLRDGVVLLGVIGALEPGCLMLKRVNSHPNNKWKRMENANYAVELARGVLDLALIGIGGIDVVDGNRKLVLALCWALMRWHCLALLSRLRVDGVEATDEYIVKWANERVRKGGREASVISGFRDSRLATSVFLLEVLWAVKPRSVSWKLVSEGGTDEEKRQNARYAISVARKLGCAVFLTWEDVVEVRPRMVMTFIASIMAMDMQKSHS